jgi:hypothetical protein
MNALKLLVIVSLLSGGAALAGQGEQGNDDEGNRGERHERHWGGFGAPEPFTVVGVAVGAGVAGLAAWRARRKRS